MNVCLLESSGDGEVALSVCVCVCVCVFNICPLSAYRTDRTQMRDEAFLRSDTGIKTRKYTQKKGWISFEES